MWESERSFRGGGCFEHGHRFHGHGSSNSLYHQAPAACWTKGGIDCRILFGTVVSEPTSYIPYTLLTHGPNSVSAISMVRVVSLMRINFADVTYTLPIPLMWSIVEEQLAIVAANVPLLRPVFSAITPSRWLGSSDRGTGPSYDFGLRKGSSKNYPLTRMDQGINKIEVTSHQSKGSRHVTTPRWSDDGVDGRSDTGLTSNGAPPDGIHMWQEFRVDETSSK